MARESGADERLRGIIAAAVGVLIAALGLISDVSGMALIGAVVALVGVFLWVRGKGRAEDT